MKVLITGGAGFIGSHLSDFLLQMGHTVVIIDNLSLGKLDNIQHNLGNSLFKFCKADLLNCLEVDAIFKREKFEMVFHLAANSDIAKSHQNPEIDLNNTFMTTFHVLNLMRKNNVKKIAFASTSAIYGETNQNLAENFGPLFPVSHYGAGKLASEAFIASFVENYGFQAWITRFPNVVGERATHGVIFDFVQKLKQNNQKLEVLGNGKQYKPYLYVKDLIEAIHFIWEHSNDKINYYNIGVETRTYVSKIAEMAIEEMGLNATIQYTGGERGWIGDVPEFNYDLGKIHQLGWRAKLTSDEAVRKAIKYILGKTK